MNVTRLRLANFKRFTDLTIDLSSFAGAPKLVLLIGANGSGKSSVFDAFEYLSAPHKGDAAPPSTRFSEGFSDGFDKGEAYDKFLSYLGKDSAAEMLVSCSFGGGFEVRRSDGSNPITSPTDWDVKSAFYGRNSLRTVPELRATPAAVDAGADPDRPRRFIDFDTRLDADVAGSRRTCSGISGARTLQARMAAVRDRVLMTLERSRNSYEVLKALPQETKARALEEQHDLGALDESGRQGVGAGDLLEVIALCVGQMNRLSFKGHT